MPPILAYLPGSHTPITIIRTPDQSRQDDARRIEQERFFAEVQAEKERTFQEIAAEVTAIHDELRAVRRQAACLPHEQPITQAWE